MIPSEVVLGPYRYSVRRVDRLTNADHTRLAGSINHQQTEICLDTDLSWSRSVVTLIHELIHGIDDIAGIGMDEDDVTRLAPLVVELFQRNPALVDLFREES